MLLFWQMLDMGTCILHVQMSASPCQWGTSGSVARMSEASRGGSLPHLINDTSLITPAPAAQQKPHAISIIIPIHISIHPSIHSFVHTNSPAHRFSGHFLSLLPGPVWKIYSISVSGCTAPAKAKARFSSCQDSVASSLNEGKVWVCMPGDKSACLLVIKVMGDGHISVWGEKRIFFISSLANRSAALPLPLTRVYTNSLLAPEPLRCCLFLSTSPKGDEIATYGRSQAAIPMANYLATEHLGHSKSHWSLQSWNDMPNHTLTLSVPAADSPPSPSPITIHGRLQNLD